MPDYIDLHIHSDHSDGLQSPREIIDRGLDLGLKAVAITDHDTLSGYEAAVACLPGKDIELATGVELSASKADDDLHILGYLFRPDDARLLETLEEFRNIRLIRGKKMVDRLWRLDMELDYREVLEVAGDAPVGRPHLAEAMVRRGLVSSYNEAFRKYLYLGGPVYVPKAKITPADAIDLIHNAGGVSVMAHPGLTGQDDLIGELAESGLDGIEIYHPAHSSADRKRYRKLAQKYDLLTCGGSDSHSRKGRYGEIGEEKVPYQCLVDLKNRRRQYV
jgi:predicted metal-dependent phosphoesterase TrpH